MSMHNLKPMSELIRKLEKKGYENNFRWENGRLVLENPKREFKPEEIQIVNEFRFEGDTDPDDMSILYALEVNTGEKGLVVNGYGISADPDLDAFLMAAKKSAP